MRKTEKTIQRVTLPTVGAINVKAPLMEALTE